MRLISFCACLILLLALASCTVITPTPTAAPAPLETRAPEAQAPAEKSPLELTVLPGIETPAPVVGDPAIVATADPALAAAPGLTENQLAIPLVEQSAAGLPDVVIQAPLYPYTVQPNSPVYLPNFARAELGCSWMGVAGQVFDATGNPLKLVVVNVTGSLNGAAISNLSITGNALAYGPGGYEVDLANQVSPSTGTLRIHLTDLQGNIISPQYAFNTVADCQKNLILINFSGQNAYQRYFPLVIVNP